MDRFVSFTTAISMIAKDIVKIKQNAMEQFGLKGSSVNCFFYMNQNKNGLTLTELARLCGEDKAATSRVVNELISKGYVDQSDSITGSKYRANLTLTSSGKEIAKYVDEKIADVFKTCGLEENSREEFYKVISLVADRIHGYK